MQLDLVTHAILSFPSQQQKKGRNKTKRTKKEVGEGEGEEKREEQRGERENYVTPLYDLL